MKKLFLGILVLVIAIVAIVMARPRTQPHVSTVQKAVGHVVNIAPAETNAATTNAAGHSPLLKMKTPLKYFSDAEKTEFQSNFVARYKPVFDKWCTAFSGRIPFSPDAVTVDKFVERIGPNSRYHEYVFVVDGITLGIEDKGGVVRVGYLNAPQETRKLATLPTGGETPIATAPISRDELIQMLYAECGVLFKPNDIRITPSGFSGSLNGGAYASVGGAPDNEASWKYDIVFGNDGKLVFYLRPVD